MSSPKIAAVLVLLYVGIVTVSVIVCSAVFILVCKITSDYSKGEAIDTSKKTSDTSAETLKKPYGDGFIINIRDYEKYINPIGNEANDYLFLHPENDEVPDDLVAFDGGRGEIQLRKITEMALTAMLAEMDAAGIDKTNHLTKLQLSATAGYKTSDDEHQLGLTVDLHNCQTADIAFKETDAYRWLSANCWRFGFILRYPDNKYAVTGETFRPWQFRFVGRYHAKAIYENNLCLEEYLAGKTQEKK